MTDFYQVLGVPFDATEEQITEAFLKLSEKYNPAHTSNPDDIKKYYLIREAYDVLIDPNKRKAYDQIYIKNKGGKFIVRAEPLKEEPREKPTITETYVYSKPSQKKSSTNWWFIILSGLLFLGAATMPYNYYKILRILTFLTSIYLILYAIAGSKTFTLLLAVLITIIFNPFLPLHFDKETWAIIDIAAAFLYFIFGVSYDPQVFNQTD